MTPSELSDLINQASTLSERLSSAWVADTSAPSLALADQRLAIWCQLAAQGDWNRFEQRLALEGLSLASVRPRLGAGCFQDDEPLPAWATILHRTLSEPGSLPDPCFDPADPLPFEEVLSPFVAFARSQLPAQEHLLSVTARWHLERQFLADLADLAGQAFFTEFALHLAAHQASLAQLLGGSGDTEYRAFVTALRQGGLAQFYRKYSALARLLATRTQHWLETRLEFEARLQADWTALSATFGDLGQQVVAVEAGLSDPHHGGRKVMAVTFASGVKLAYKPRSLALDIAWDDLLAWCNEQGLALPLKRLRALNRPDYGWQEWASAQPCPDHAAVERYYRRGGMVLCLLHLLEATDCHAENIIAQADQPLLLDPEMLLSPRPQLDEFSLAATSLIRTAFLPDANLPADDFIAGLGEGPAETRQFVWQAINQDSMALREVTLQPEPYHNLPRLHSQPQPASHYAAAIKAGFSEMAHFLRRHPQVWQAADSPLARFKGLASRFAPRHTHVYGQVLHKLRQAAYLRQGIERSLQLEILSGTFLHQAEARPFWPLFRYERLALEQLDVPYFSTQTDGLGVRVSGQTVVQTCFARAGYQQVLANFETLASDKFEVNLSFHLDLIDSVFYGPQDFSADLVSPASDFLAHAIAIGHTLEQRAIRLPNGHLTWLLPVYQPRYQSYRAEFMGDGLYEGRAGVAMYLAALAQLTAPSQPELAERWRKMALTVAQQLDSTWLDLGAERGLGGQLYSLVCLSQLLAEPLLHQRAHQLAQRLTYKRIQAEASAGVLDGLAGAILGLLKLYRANGEASVLDQALACGAQVLRQAQASDTGQRVWPTERGQFLTGFSHGSAGIGYALSQLYHLSGQRRFLLGAAEARAYERAVFSSGAKNWPDFRGDSSVFGASWCNGALGIGLARLSGLNRLDGSEAAQEVRTALAVSRREGWIELDTLCCGNFGQVEGLLEAGLRLSHSAWVAQAQQQAAALLERAKQQGGYQLFDDLPPQTYNPSFFRGLAGIAYTLLRLVQAGRTSNSEQGALPCVLLFA